MRGTRDDSHDESGGSDMNGDEGTSAPTPPAGSSREGPRRVLCVDDEPSIGRLVTRMLATDIVETFERPQLALERARAAHFDAVLCDYRMPEMSGMAFYESLLQIRPELAGHFTLMTGSLSDEHASEAGDVRVLRKPFTRQQLQECIARKPEP